MFEIRNIKKQKKQLDTQKGKTMTVRERAIKAAIKHWTDNVAKLTKNIGKVFLWDFDKDNAIIIGTRHISYDATDCALCQEYMVENIAGKTWKTKCVNKAGEACPLISCDHGSTWQKFMEHLDDVYYDGNGTIDNEAILLAQAVLDKLKKAK